MPIKKLLKGLKKKKKSFIIAKFDIDTLFVGGPIPLLSIKLSELGSLLLKKLKIKCFRPMSKSIGFQIIFNMEDLENGLKMLEIGLFPEIDTGELRFLFGE